jgi:radical SAM superfamily enzyme with C-terminal helix-hairpin-helix motif
MSITLLDCYTDEPAGLGVPPYLGTYPRYITGYYALEKNENLNYLTIDDLRYFVYYKEKKYDKYNLNKAKKTNIKIYNLTKNYKQINNILEKTTELIIILGVHTPGKYLSAVPGTLNEIRELLRNFKFRIILTGPAIYGTRLEGGKFFENQKSNIFDEIQSYDFPYKYIKDYAIKGAEIIKQIQSLRIIEIETGHGCSSAKCSFCTEPLKHKLEFRKEEDILNEIKEFYNLGIRYFRLGKQSCFYTYPNPINLLKSIKKMCTKIKVIHIDNVNPKMVIDKRGIAITKAIVKYCSAGNIAAFGVESFDKKVIKANCLNAQPEQVYEAVKIINKYGKERDNNGMPRFLPGINLLFGLKNETKDTFSGNYKWLKKILNNNLLIRRINIRQVTIFKGTPLYKECGNKFLKKNKRYYWKWRNKIRQSIDFEMLRRLLPEGTILKNVRAEIYDGNTTFARQIGTYPLIVGVKTKLELGKFYNIRITGYMLRSVIGEVCANS